VNFEANIYRHRALTNHHPLDLTGTCTGYEFLVFNNTNIGLLTPCTQINYACYNPSRFAIYNSSTVPPDDCYPWAYNLAVDTNFTGPLILPNISTAYQVFFQGVYPFTDHLTGNLTQAEDPLNVTRIELPDLTEVRGGFGVQYADKIEALEAPKLRSVDGDMSVDLSGFNGSVPPSIGLSFESLESVWSISLVGNIDA
jgi:hypothetical protein